MTARVDVLGGKMAAAGWARGGAGLLLGTLIDESPPSVAASVWIVPFEFVDAGLAGYLLAYPRHAVSSSYGVQQLGIGLCIPADDGYGALTASPDARVSMGIRSKIDVAHKTFGRVDFPGLAASIVLE